MSKDVKINTTFAENFIKKIEYRERKEKELLESDEYILWLQKFTEVHTHFYDNEWVYSVHEVSSTDLQRVADLYLLYRAIDKYASSNYIDYNIWEFGNFYYIKHKGIGYKIGIMDGQGTCFFCERVEIDDWFNFISFEDIQNNKERAETKAIREKLQVLEQQIKNLVNYDKVPINFIESTVQTSINELKKNS